MEFQNYKIDIKSTVDYIRDRSVIILIIRDRFVII